MKDAMHVIRYLRVQVTMLRKTRPRPGPPLDPIAPLASARRRLEKAAKLTARIGAMLLWATTVSAAQFTLGWQDNSGNELGFRVERAPAATGPWVVIGFTPVDAQSYVDPGLADATQYCYRVVAVANGAESEPSNVACKTTPVPAPSGLTISLIGDAFGKVVSSPSGINCGRGSTLCTKLWPVGTAVKLSVTLASNGIFDGWSGACAFVAAGVRTCSLKITGPMLVGVSLHGK